MTPIYFLPDVHKGILKPEELPEPLNKLFCKEVLVARVGVGPEKQQGTIFTRYINPTLGYGQEAVDTAYNATEQKWLQSNTGKYWLGYIKAQPPTPDDLRRKTLIDGHVVEIDNNEWLIPVLGPPRFSKLPVAYQKRGTEYIQEIVDDYIYLFELSQKFIGKVETQKLTDSDFWEFFTLCFSVNYLIGDDEVNLLKLHRSDTGQQVVEIATGMVDLRKFIEEQKEGKAVGV